MFLASQASAVGDTFPTQPASSSVWDSPPGVFVQVVAIAGLCVLAAAVVAIFLKPPKR
jgi:hypothetical protein